jgi:hypothetical protein
VANDTSASVRRYPDDGGHRLAIVRPRGTP